MGDKAKRKVTEEVRIKLKENDLLDRGKRLSKVRDLIRIKQDEAKSAAQNFKAEIQKLENESKVLEEEIRDQVKREEMEVFRVIEFNNGEWTVDHSSIFTGEVLDGNVGVTVEDQRFWQNIYHFNLDRQVLDKKTGEVVDLEFEKESIKKALEEYVEEKNANTTEQ